MWAAPAGHALLIAPSAAPGSVMMVPVGLCRAEGRYVQRVTNFTE